MPDHKSSSLPCPLPQSEQGAGKATQSARAVDLTHALDGIGETVMPMWLNRHAQLAEFAQVMLMSASDGYERAQVTSVQLDVGNLQAGNWAALLPILKQALEQLERKFLHPLVWCRLEWPFAVREWHWLALKQEIKRYKRNYFRSGIAFVGKRFPRLLLTEMELNANACLYAGNQVAHADVNQAHLERYIKARHGSSQMPDFADNMPAWSFSTTGVFVDVSGEKANVHALDTQPRRWGRRATPPLTAVSTGELIARSTRFLGKQVSQDGRYVYGYFPCFDRRINTYNSLRHASSTYALLEGYEACAEQALLSHEELDVLRQQIASALSGLCSQFVIHRQGAAYVVDVGDIIKLGANAVAILALVKYHQVTGDDRYAELADALALGISRMQETDGSFVHVLNAADLSVKEKTRIIYYDGEAAFALMRLYDHTRDSRWLACVVKAFDYFIASGHENAHDHWLAYCSNELVTHCPERKYFAFAVRNIAGYVDFIRERITTFPTLLELSMAFHKTLLKLEKRPDLADVLNGFDTNAFYRALHARANYLLNGFFWPEVAMYFKAPATIVDGFFIRHHSFRVRIDDVEHYLSGLVAYQQMLREGGYASVKPPLGNRLDAKAIASATEGRWTSVPSDEWQARGLCCWPKSFQPGQVVVARGKEMDKGFLPFAAVRSLVSKGASAVLCDDSEAYRDIGVPVLQVPDVRAATLAIGRWQRRCYAGRVVGITGSAGKTTAVAMLAHVLSYSGAVGQTQGSANLPIGIAWNIASMPQEARYWVVEMAIGSMAQNTELARPDIAIITNIAASHLVYHRSLDEIARKKALIFQSMPPDGVAILYRDMPQYTYLAEQARRYHLQVVSFGEHPDADIRMLEFAGNSGRIMFDGAVYELCMSAAGRHMLLNAMAVLAVARHEHLPLETIMAGLASFQAVVGRGEVRGLDCCGMPITLYDETYNANPLSMRMALEAFSSLPVEADKKLLIIGDMLELGSAAEALHQELVPILATLSARKILLCGQHCQALAPLLGGEACGVFHFADVNALESALPDHLMPQDSVLAKASHGTGLHTLFSQLPHD
ncbi:UDP-N-acetylmuramoyl-tripeptide--D-alanyl-D-alanine ligase [Vreelandella alkaliphila]|uniref:UDP-N-acetylmuramoyl-tripeptide--D-alanyl-D-alanine ligase n=1 Tax=Vreelandella alkaliphila TaxID=272774 RepID=A0A7C9P1D6_9GAMM|nr:UDP-N-acetylmuramoyl-tripeptide--D-alanyl-D-alanine ligase [Halomonas alkaliphila]NDL71053.1 UDP-N-acetylmuramoyl-tripeptide--D-alanyl-D-alanine ligase [Halomonas alkaliphila]